MRRHASIRQAGAQPTESGGFSGSQEDNPALLSDPIRTRRNWIIDEGSPPPASQPRIWGGNEPRFRSI